MIVRLELNEGTSIAAPYVDGRHGPAGGDRVAGGHITVPQGPGLGVTPEPEIFGDPVAGF